MSLNNDPVFQWALPESLKVPADQLRVRLDFYNDAVIMHLINDGVISTRMVSAHDVALAMLRSVPLSSGLLPEGALWWSQAQDGPTMALWRPRRVWKVALVTEPFQPPRRLKLPMPGLIFICQPARPPRVYAAKERPRDPGNRIYHAPLFNVFGDGRTCPGTHQYPENINEIPESFFASFFSPTADYRGRSKKYPDNLLKLWEKLDGAKRYPLGDLVTMGKVEDIIR